MSMILGLFNTYYDYISSDIWNEKCDWLKKTRGYYCEICKSNEYPRVHHKNYNNLGSERSNDLLIVCSFCHMMIHEYAFNGSADVILTITRSGNITNVKWIKTEENNGKIKIYHNNTFMKEIEVCSK